MINEWIAIEQVREALDDIRRRLRAGAEGPGATLDASDCKLALACLQKPALPNSRPPKVNFPKLFIALHCRHLENAGVSPKIAVIETAKHFNCSITTVRTARK